MKCSNCGMEFGDGASCQHCGVDRVIGGASLSGYQMPSGIGSASNEAVQTDNVYQSETNMICVYCEAVIPADAEFCPFCAKKLYANCPKCGHKYSTKYPVCPQCGTNREQFYAEQKALEEERREKLEQQRKEEEKQRLEKERAFTAVRQSSIYNEMLQYLTKLNNYLVDNKFSGESAGLKGIPGTLFIFIMSLLPIIIMTLLEGEFRIDEITIIFGTISIVSTTIGVILNNRKQTINALTPQLIKSIISEYIEKNSPSTDLTSRALSSIKEDPLSFNILKKYTNETLDKDIIHALSSEKIPIVCKDGSVLQWV